MYIQKVSPNLEKARLDVIEKFSTHLQAEILLAQHGDGFFEQKYWHKYLTTKYECQESSNKFYVLLHELSQ